MTAFTTLIIYAISLVLLHVSITFLAGLWIMKFGHAMQLATMVTCAAGVTVATAHRLM